MLDLLGDPLQGNAPNTLPPSRVLNGAQGFPEWWLAWGAHFRKADKQKCLDRWSKEGYAEQAVLIRQHTEFMLTQPEWLKDGGAFRCAPIVYLRREAWREWAPVAALERPLVDPALSKIREDDKKAAPLSEEMRRKLAELRGKR